MSSYKNNYGSKIKIVYGDLMDTSTDLGKVGLAVAILFIVIGFYLILSPIAKFQNGGLAYGSYPDDEEEIFFNDEFGDLTELNADLRTLEKHRKDRNEKYQDFMKRTKTVKERMVEVSLPSLKLESGEIKTSLLNQQIANDSEVQEYIRKWPHFNFKPPLNFLDVVNPCFMDNKDVRCLPYFYLTGFPQCGITTLWEKLQQHPQLAKVEESEPVWWDEKRFQLETVEGGGNMTVYTQHFAAVDTDKMVHLAGDASTTTAWNNYPTSVAKPPMEPCTFQLLRDLRERRIILPQLINAYTPDAKFIIMLRNPVDRLYADFLAKSKTKTELKKTFHDLVLKQLRKFFECIADYDLRFCVYEKETGLQNNLGLYAVFMRDILSVIPRENVLPVKYENFVKNPMDVLQKVCQFLGVKIPEGTMDKMLYTDSVYEPEEDDPMWPKTRKILSEFYEPFNKELSILLSNSSFQWEEISA